MILIMKPITPTTAMPKKVSFKYKRYSSLLDLLESLSICMIDFIKSNKAKSLQDMG